MRRWEKTQGLPVHRHPYLKRGLVYGYKEELDSWWNDGHERPLEVMPASEGNGEGRRREVPPRQGWRRWRTWTIALAAGFAVVLLAQRLGVDRGELSDRRTDGLHPAPIGSIAVLPLENLSGDTGQEYFSDGMTDALISELGKVGALRVISRQSVMRFKGSELSVPEIARALKVDAVAEGSVQRSDDRVRITIRLLRVEPEEILWAESYERDLEDVLVLQGEMARAIATGLEPAVIPGETRRLAEVGQVDPKAYDAYLRGSYHWQKLNARDADTAELYLELALQEDASFAPAWAGLAWVWLVREKAGAASVREAAPKARAAALRAVKLDGRSAEAHLALAVVKTWYDWDWDWAGAHSEWRRSHRGTPKGRRAQPRGGDGAGRRAGSPPRSARRSGPSRAPGPLRRSAAARAGSSRGRAGRSPAGSRGSATPRAGGFARRGPRSTRGPRWRQGSRSGSSSWCSCRLRWVRGTPRSGLRGSRR